MKKKPLLRVPLRYYLLLIAVVLANYVFAQDKITGTVTDAASGHPIAGASVNIKNSTIATMTDIAGNYSIAAKPSDVLVFTFVGYGTQDMAVNGNSVINVLLQTVATDLNEVVVVGYGTQRKKDVTSAISIVDVNNLKKRQGTTLADNLQGLATGIKVRGSGRPGEEAQIQIRGLKTFGGTTPLYVIDGLIVPSANRDFNQEDIESIQILKDGAAAAIYGSRAANGVVIITTKKGKSKGLAIDASAKYGVQIMPTYNLMNATEFIALNNQAYENAGLTKQTFDPSINTDWQKATFRQGTVQDYNASFSNAGDNASFYMSGGYYGNKGTVIGTGFERFSFRVNSQASRGIFSIGENISISNAKSHEMRGNPIIDVVRMLPTIPVYDPANPGGYGYGNDKYGITFGTNPVAIANLIDPTNENFRVRGNVWSELKILRSLTYRLNLGYETSRDHGKTTRRDGSWTRNQPIDPNYISESRGQWESKIIENTLTFKETFNKHNITLIGGQSMQKELGDGIWGKKLGVPYTSTGQYYFVLDQGATPTVGGSKWTRVLQSYFGRLEYGYDNRYLINGVVRYDGSSVLAPGKRWGVFPSVSGAWRISNEKFFNVAAVNDLKLRASYGILGASNIDNYQYIATISTAPFIPMGTAQALYPTGTQIQLVNEDLRWERVINTNIGIDAALFNNTISLTAEYFKNKTNDVLAQLPILAVLGGNGNPVVNAAGLQNTGVEVSVGYKKNFGGIGLNTNLNVTTLKNKVTSLGYGGNDIFTGLTKTTVGQPMGMWYLLQTNGIFNTQAEIDNYKNSKGVVIQPNARPGDLKFTDVDDNGQINNNDKIIAGNPWPKVEVGYTLGLDWKNFDFSMDWFGSFGAKVISAAKWWANRFDDNSNYFAGTTPWTVQNPSSTPRALYASNLNARQDIDRWLESGNFVRLKLLSLGYSVPKTYLSKIAFKSARIAVTAQNILTFTKYSGLDPEFSNTSLLEKSFDFGAYPNVKTIAVSLNLGF